MFTDWSFMTYHNHMMQFKPPIPPDVASASPQLIGTKTPSRQLILLKILGHWGCLVSIYTGKQHELQQSQGWSFEYHPLPIETLLTTLHSPDWLNSSHHISKRLENCITSWWFQPNSKILVKLEHFPTYRGKKYKIFETITQIIPDQHGGLKWGDKVVSKNNLELDFLNKPPVELGSGACFWPFKMATQKEARVQTQFNK